MTIVSKPATTQVPISSLLANRFSPRIYDPSKGISHEQKLALAEAARWAPSSSNSQPWNFAFLDHGTELFDQVCEKGLTGFNQSWAPSASLLVVVMRQLARPDGTALEPNVTHYNLGLASAQLVFQAEDLGFKSHYMTGIVPDAIDALLEVAGYKTFSVIAIGRQAELETAASELQEREAAQRERKPLDQIVSHGLAS